MTILSSIAIGVVWGALIIREQKDWKTYENKDYGYSVRIPKTWSVGDTFLAGLRTTVVSEPDGRVRVQATVMKDERLSDVAYLKESMKKFKKMLEGDTLIKQLRYRDFVRRKSGGFVATGEDERDGERYHFEYRGWLYPDGRVVIFLGAVRADVYREYYDKVMRVMGSFKLPQKN